MNDLRYFFALVMKETSMLERDYQAKLIERIEERIPGCQILKNDTGYQQGIPDLSVFCQNWYAVLEVKKSEDSVEQPNQRYFVEMFNAWSFGAFIYPENEEEVLDALQQSFESSRAARLSKRQ